MIKTFKCKETARIFEGSFSSKFPSDIQNRALVKLRMIDVASTLDDLKNPPGNRLKSLSGKHQEFMSIRINDQWRIMFRWVNNEAYDVELCDYH